MNIHQQAQEGRLGNEWAVVLKEEFESPYMKSLWTFLQHRRDSGVAVYPPPEQVFAAFSLTPPKNVQVVILGQDPYHGVGQAHGLCFSVNPGTPVPPSLRNIFRELQTDLQLKAPTHGCLKAWSTRGVLLLNTVLTVEEGQPGAHQGKGWEQFTDRVIQRLCDGDRPLVFMLWGAQAQKKGQSIDANRHCVLQSSHPSPLSAHRGFIGCRHFSKANAFLRSQGLTAIDWSVPD